ncbi:uncharacterized protein C8Q71DRAFT_708529, partial [Rhodofomes roseus]
STTVLCCYDYCLTFASEVKYVWSRKLSLASALFYAFRYLAVFNTIFVALGYFHWPSWQSTLRSCVIVIRLEMAGDVLILSASAQFAVFTALRIYALVHGNMYLFATTLGLGLIAPIISTYTFVNSQPILAQITPSYQFCYIQDAFATNW